MRSKWKLVIAGLSLGLVSGPAFAHNDVGISFSIAVPGASAYVGSAPGYYPPPVYAEPPVVYYDAPPTIYYAPPAQVYYDEPPSPTYYAPSGVPVYYGRPHEEHREHRHWRRDRDRQDDDD